MEADEAHESRTEDVAATPAVPEHRRGRGGRANLGSVRVSLSHSEWSPVQVQSAAMGGVGGCAVRAMRIWGWRWSAACERRPPPCRLGLGRCRVGSLPPPEPGAGQACGGPMRSVCSMEDMHMVDLDGGCHGGRLSIVRPRCVRFGCVPARPIPAPHTRTQRPSPLGPTQHPPPALPSPPESCMSICWRAHTHVRSRRSQSRGPS